MKRITTYVEPGGNQHPFEWTGILHPRTVEPYAPAIARIGMVGWCPFVRVPGNWRIQQGP